MIELLAYHNTSSVPIADLYRLEYSFRGYAREEFVYRDDLIDTLVELMERGIPVSRIRVEE